METQYYGIGLKYAHSHLLPLIDKRLLYNLHTECLSLDISFVHYICYSLPSAQKIMGSSLDVHEIHF